MKIIRRSKECKTSSACSKNVDFRQCLAKTDSDYGLCNPGMSVLEHCLITGYTATAIMQSFPYLRAIGLFPEGSVIAAALHDAGKISPVFQKKITDALSNPELRKRIYANLGLPDCFIVDIPHAEISQAAVSEIAGNLSGIIAGMHHGGLSSLPGPGTSSRYGGPLWQRARADLALALSEEFGSTYLHQLSSAELAFLAGFTVVSDWIGSSIRVFSGKHEASKEACHAVEKAGFCIHSFCNGLEFADVFGFSPRLEQRLLSDAYAGNGIYILEAEMGTGKTEAALYLAYLLLSQGKADGIYFALPTTITSRNMYGRFASFVNKILLDESISPKLVFASSGSALCGEMEPGHSWFDSRKRLILAPFGIGTADQAVMSVLNVRHSAVRTFGLAGKVVIIDEVHSYDQYTGTLIRDLIKQLQALGSTVIILSATLRRSDKRDLLGIGKNVPLSDSYPCVTSLVNGQLKEFDSVPDKHRTVSIIHENNDSVAMDKAIDDAMNGKYVIWIENDVLSSQKAYLVFAARLTDTGIGCSLLHSRFTHHDRASIEREIIPIYGQEGLKSRGTGPGFILVGTQVLEQSLDIDADVMYSRIAPMDMILQRVGRLWRHDIPSRKGKPVLHLLHPSAENTAENPDLFGRSGSVYSSYILYRTLRVIEDLDTIHLPYAIRDLIEQVYAEDVSESLSTLMEKEKRKLEERRETLKRLAREAEMHIGHLGEDNVSTRFSSVPMRDVLLVRDVDFINRIVMLPDGHEVSLCSGSLEERAETASLLMDNIVSVPSYKIQFLDMGKTIAAQLSEYLYISDDPETRIMVAALDNEKIKDLSGNLIEESRYSGKIGYYIEKEISGGK